MDSKTLVGTNISTLYAYSGTDLANDGPTVIEVPPGMLGFLDDAWQRFVGNIGVTGPDKGQGGGFWFCLRATRAPSQRPTPS